MGLLTWTLDRIRGFFHGRRAAADLVADNDAKALAIQTDLDRWMPDRHRRLEEQLNGLVTSAGPQLYSGSLRNGLEHAMGQALEQYRNEASAKVRAFGDLARREGGARKGAEGPTLRLSETDRKRLASWRERPHPVPQHPDDPPLRATPDPTEGDEEIAPLEAEDGLTWAEAAKRGTL